MKKFRTLIITLLITIMCLMSISPAFAAYPDGWMITSWYNLDDYFKRYLHDGDTVTLTLYDNLIMADELEIEADDCTITIDTALDHGKGYTIYANDCSEHFLNITGDNVKIIFKDIRIYGCHYDGDGGSIYVDGEGCEIVGAEIWYSNATVDGGAICLNRDDATVDSCTFVSCHAGDDGGAIYVCAGADDCVIKNCYFNKCSCEARGNAVCGDRDTEVQNCGSNTTSSYELCKVSNSIGSVLSDGNLVIVLIIAVAAIICVAILIIAKKKKRENCSAIKK